MSRPLFAAVCLSIVLVSACGKQDAEVIVTPATGTPTAREADGMPAVLPPEVIEITSTAQFDAEITKPRPGATIIADFHAAWCAPCRKLGPELVALAQQHPGKLFVLRVDFDQHPQLAERYQAESLPLLVKFADGKEIARMVGIEKDKAKFRAWLGLPKTDFN